ncbi:hypothetical protein DFH11DRAFT_1588312 [Phellopilus nigrolimitatus]|nr:hypothetical protein DFH11DRAFT_1588312 [Phellopilus nigrolimitatus]
MPPDIVYVTQRDPLQYRPGVNRTRNVKDDGEGSHAREIELKRSRGEISCAECRRLKIKCDKQLPCSSCLRRGCASLCPNGSLSTGQGTRFVLAATDHLHRRIAKMSERIRQLEDALAILQTSVTEEPHPLLRDELLSLKVDKSEEVVDVEGTQEIQESIDAFGTLSIGDKGSFRFFGASGGSEILLLNDDGDEPYSSPSASASNSGDSPPSVPLSTRDSKSPRLHPELALFSNSFPFTPIGPTREVQKKIETFLPPWENGLALAETYAEQAGWLYRAISRPQLFDEILPAIYGRTPANRAHEHAIYKGPHALSLVLMVFALGTLVDLNREPFSAQADHYYQLAKAAITLQSVLERPEVVTIQALHLMSVYNAMRQPDVRDEEGETSMEMSWSLIRLCHQLAQTIDRDSSRWGLSPLEVQRRRALFWDLVVADSWQSLATGRPPSITMPYIDCEFPLDDEARLNDKGQQEPGFGSWGFRFARDCVGPVAAKTLTASVPSYATILELDAKIRDFSIPEIPKDIPYDRTKPSEVMTRCVLAHSRETILLNLHRSFFAQAMIDDPVNPLRSQYAPSFLATYRSALHILKSIREEFGLLPELSARFWSPWTYAFSSAVVFGSIVTRGPSSSMAPSSLEELDSACELFFRASQHSRRAAKALVNNYFMQATNKGSYCVRSCLRIKASSNSTSGEAQQLQTAVEEKDDELALFSGRVRLVSSKRGGSSSSDSPPYMQGVETPDGTVTFTPPPSQPRAVHRVSEGKVPVIRRPSVSEVSTLSPATRSSDSSDDSFYPPAWAGSVATDYRGLYPERGSGTYIASSPEYPANMKYEWTTSPTVEALAGHAQHQHSLPSTPRYPHSNSHSSHPVMGGMDGMEYGHSSSSAGLPPYVPQHHSHQHFPHHIPHPNHHVQPHPQRVQNQSSETRYGYAPPSSSSQSNASTYYSSPGDTSPNIGGLTYATAPRELAEIGLASQHSGLDQRWTSFMQDSGLFYGPGGPT